MGQHRIARPPWGCSKSSQTYYGRRLLGIPKKILALENKSRRTQAENGNRKSIMRRIQIAGQFQKSLQLTVKLFDTRQSRTPKIERALYIVGQGDYPKARSLFVLLQNKRNRYSLAPADARGIDANSEGIGTHAVYHEKGTRGRIAGNQRSASSDVVAARCGTHFGIGS